MFTITPQRHFVPGFAFSLRSNAKQSSFHESDVFLKDPVKAADNKIITKAVVKATVDLFLFPSQIIFLILLMIIRRVRIIM